MEAKFSPRSSKPRYVTHCSVPRCFSKSNVHFDVIFHYFPPPSQRFVWEKNYFGKFEKIDVFKIWKKRLQIRDVHPHTRVCSLHFSRNDYILPDFISKKRQLKKTAVPSYNLPNTARNVELKKNRESRLMNRNKKKLKSQEQVNVKHSELQESIQITTDSQECQECSSIDVSDIKEVSDYLHQISTLPAKQDVGVQVNTVFCQPRFINIITSDSLLSTLTGIESFDVLNTIVDIVTNTFGNEIEHHNAKMTIREKIVMTYVKLKQNFSYYCLAASFQCYTAKTCQRVFYDMIKILSECLRVFIKWPSKEIVSKNLPKCFKDFEDVRVVLDCTEIHVQRPKHLCCQLITYSNYKKSQTIKFMTGVTPAGNLCYISKAYGGRASDKAIFEHGHITKLLERGDGIMVDKGFRIDEICLKNEWKCYQPPFLKDQKQFSASDVVFTHKIAKARVHIERSNQRIKIFKIFGEKMSSNLIPLVEDIFKVNGATVNLNSPIMKDDKFMKIQ